MSARIQRAWGSALFEIRRLCNDGCWRGHDPCVSRLTVIGLGGGLLGWAPAAGSCDSSLLMVVSCGGTGIYVGQIPRGGSDDVLKLTNQARPAVYQIDG